jgi:hypothetical protein
MVWRSAHYIRIHIRTSIPQLFMDFRGRDNEKVARIDRLDNIVSERCSGHRWQCGWGGFCEVAIVPNVLQNVRLDSRWTQADDPYPVWPKMKRKSLRHPNNCVFGRSVRQPVPAIRQQSGGRRGVDDLPVSLLKEEGQKHEIAAHHTQQIDIYRVLPLLEWYVFRFSHSDDAHVVHDEINSPKTLQEKIPSALKMIEPSDIQLHSNGVAFAVLSNFGRHLLGPLQVDICHDEAGAPTSKREGACTTDAAARTGHNARGSLELDKGRH